MSYLGFPEGLSGSELAGRALRQAERLGAEMVVSREAVGLQVVCSVTKPTEGQDRPA